MISYVSIKNISFSLKYIILDYNYIIGKGHFPNPMAMATAPLQLQWDPTLQIAMGHISYAMAIGHHPSPLALSCSLPPMAMGQPSLFNRNGPPLYHIIIFHAETYYIICHYII